eukprot:scaffold260165_cov17-Prasinocladus_malaysianus.AAC.1
MAWGMIMPTVPWPGRILAIANLFMGGTMRIMESSGYVSIKLLDVGCHFLQTCPIDRASGPALPPESPGARICTFHENI